MISRETAFIDLTKPENLDRINIDKKLVPAFIAVMKKMQDYFSAKGLMHANNYALLFEKYLITDDSNNKFAIKLAKLASTDSGNYLRHDRKILINENIYEEYFEITLCHEFIHFLILTDRPYIENKNGEFVQKIFRLYPMNFQYGTFINEAATEYINKKIYPNCPFYKYQVKMLDYFNKIISNKNNIVEFLRGYIPFDKCEIFEDINRDLKAFQKDNFDAINYNTLSKNVNYMNAQGKLVTFFTYTITKEIQEKKFDNIIDYVKRVYEIEDAEPIKTYQLKEALKNANLTFLSDGLNLDISNKFYQKLFLSKLENIIKNYKNIQNNVIIEREVEIANTKIKVQIKQQEVCLNFGNVLTKTLKRNGKFSNKIISYKAYDKNGQEYDNELFVDFFESEINISTFKPTHQEHILSFDHKKLKNIQNNIIKNLKNDINFLQTQKKLRKTKTQIESNQRALEQSL